MTTVFIAIAAAFIGFIIGLCVSVDYPVPVWTPPEPNPVKLFNAADSKPKEEVREPVVVSKVVMSKRIKELEYNKRVNAALKEVVDKAVNVWVSGNNNAFKNRVASELYHEWHVRLENVNYRYYKPSLQRLNIIGRRVENGFKFEAFWEPKDPKKK